MPTWNTAGSSSPAILYMLGIMSISPCDAVNVVASAPAASAPCTAPAAPSSLSISLTTMVWPKRFLIPPEAHLPAVSPISATGVMGYTVATSENAYAAYAAAVQPSMIL